MKTRQRRLGFTVRTALKLKFRESSKERGYAYETERNNQCKLIFFAESKHRLTIKKTNPRFI